MWFKQNWNDDKLETYILNQLYVAKNMIIQYIGTLIFKLIQ